MRRVVAIGVALLIVVAVVVAWRAGYFDAGKLDTVRAAMRAARDVPLAPAAFIVAYALAVILLLPTTALALIGGALFGMPALALTWIGSMIGSICAYALGRYTGQRLVRRFLGNHALLRRLRDDASIPDLMRLRVLPVAPFGVLDYLAGMSAIPLRTLLLATGMAILPPKGAYVFAGRQMGRALEGTGSAKGALVVAGAITALLFVVAVAPTLVKMIARRGKREGTARPGPR